MAKATVVTPPTSEKFKKILLMEQELNKQFNTTKSIVRLGDRVGVRIPSIPTNLATVDYDVIGCGGIPRGKIIEVFGPESSGKTSFCLHIVGEEQVFQKQFEEEAQKVCGFVDAEHALDPNYAKVLGVDVDNLFVSQPDSGEQALETVESMVDSGLFSLIVVDSVAALVPQAELNGEMGDSHMGLQARLMSQAMRKLTAKCSKNNVTVIFINQIREKIGVMFGSPETTTGGRALKFFASVRLDVRRREVIGEKESPIGHNIDIKAVKNKTSAPFRKTSVRLLYVSGFDKLYNLIEYSKDVGVLEGTTWIKYKGGNLGQGIDNTIEFLKDNPKILESIRKDVKEL